MCFIVFQLKYAHTCIPTKTKWGNNHVKPRCVVMSKACARACSIHGLIVFRSITFSYTPITMIMWSNSYHNNFRTQMYSKVLGSWRLCCKLQWCTTYVYCRWCYTWYDLNCLQFIQIVHLSHILHFNSYIECTAIIK